jgi:hypothetical protein
VASNVIGVRRRRTATQQQGLHAEPWKALDSRHQVLLRIALDGDVIGLCPSLPRSRECVRAFGPRDGHGALRWGARRRSTCLKRRPISRDGSGRAWVKHTLTVIGIDMATGWKRLLQHKTSQLHARSAVRDRQH